MNKGRIFSGLVILSSMLILLTACSSNSGETKKVEKEPDAGQNSKVAVSIEDGTYIIPDGETVDEDTGFLALAIKVKNKTDKNLDVTSSDFSLYDEDGEKVSSEHVYDSQGKFKLLSSESLSEGKSFTKPLVFKVAKAAEYELHYEPVYSSDEEEKGIELKIATEDYPDDAKAVEGLMDQYIETVFYNSDPEESEEKSKLELSNDLDEERKAFKEEAINLLKKGFPKHNVSTEEAETFISQVQASNREKAKVSYRFKEFFPETASLYVRPETVLLKKEDKDAIVKQFTEENKGKFSDYATAQREAEKYLVQELPAKIKEITISTDEDMTGEGYRVNLEKKDGKWTINSANDSQNYTFKSLKDTFRCGLHE
ncbi:DUF4352 domain-containing protein [Enterococcus sp. DIV0756]|uniref:DUF4352 domain-containing protein n=1 Tax=Enterococcus sp. DIV0756 TaxID=2774636 RepID=UPI003F22450C